MIDWKLLYVPIIVLLIALLISGGLWLWADAYNTVQVDEYTKLERDNTSAKRRYSDARRDRALYKEYLDSYLQYQNQGIIGAEQRLSWIEQLEAINKGLKLSSLRYEISPQAPAEVAGLKLPRDIKINTSIMKLTAGLLHEGDALHLLNELKNRAKGLFAVRHCDLTSRIGQTEDIRYRPNASYVGMACELEWYTIEVVSS